MLRPLSLVLCTALLGACASNASNEDNASGGKPAESDMRTIASGTSMSLRQGETVRLPDDATLKYVAVTQDSRCPPNVQCIRAGDADIAFEFAGGATAARVTLNLPESPTASMGAWRLTVESLEFGQMPPVTVRIDPAQ
jgi:hypothetical protein